MKAPTPDIDGAVPTELVELIPTITGQLARLNDDDPYFFIEMPHIGRYMQFAAFGPNLRGETVGNTNIAEGTEMHAQELAWLTGHGWNDPDECGNHWRHWRPSDPDQAALVTVVTLHQVHHITRASQIDFASVASCEADLFAEGSL